LSIALSEADDTLLQYIGAGNPFGDGAHLPRRQFATNEKTSAFSENFHGDIGQVNTANEEEEGY
jgi:hypothetical protein